MSFVLQRIQWRVQKIEELNSDNYKNSCKFTTLSSRSMEDPIYFGFYHKFMAKKYVNGVLVRGRVRCIGERPDSWVNNFLPCRNNKICNFQRKVDISSLLPVKLYRFSLVSLYPCLEQILVEAATESSAPYQLCEE